MRIAHCRHGDYHGVKNEKGCNLRKDTRRGLLLQAVAIDCKRGLHLIATRVGSDRQP